MESLGICWKPYKSLTAPLHSEYLPPLLQHIGAISGAQSAQKSKELIFVVRNTHPHFSQSLKGAAHIAIYIRLLAF